MLRKLYSTVFAILTASTLALSQSGIFKGKVIDDANGEAIPFANVGLFQNGTQMYSGVSDIEGDITIKPITPGKYDVRSTFVGYQPIEIKGLLIEGDKTRYYDIKLKSTATQLTEVEIIEYKEPLIDPDTKSGGTVTREEFQAMPSKNINSVAATTAGVFQKDEGDAVNVRGARSDATDKYIDGEKVIGSANVPQSSVEQVSVITGGLPAQYGDATGGVISVTTRGPQSQFFGGVELITSEVLDKYGYNFLGFSVGGPILMKNDSATGMKQSVLGYIISGEAITEKDDDPSAVGAYKIKDSILSQLEQAPLRVADVGTGTVKNAEFLRLDDMEKIKARQNVRSNSIRLNGKIDYKPTSNINFTLGGSIDYNNRHSYVYEYALLNPANNPQNISNTWRVYGKITQKFGSNEAKQDEKTSAFLTNAYYTLQVGYQNSNSKTQDDSHKGNIFNYGYVGKFKTYKAVIADPLFGNFTFQNGPNGMAYYQNSFSDTLVTYDPGTSNEFLNGSGEFENPNPLAAVYTQQYYDLIPGDPVSLSQVLQGGGLRNGDRPANIYALWYNTGRQYNGYSFSNSSQFRVSTSFSADIKKKHAVIAGFEFEQRTDRSWASSPMSMWGLMRQLANSHITQLDESNPIFYQGGTYNWYIYNRLVDSESQTQFDKSLRDKVGAAPDEWIDVDNLDPNTFSLDMFSAKELLDNGLVAYYGYDYTGKKQTGNPSFSDFFTKKDENGNYTREIAPFQPIYIAGYIQDKFDFKDLKFNVGLRIDRFDANQMVLKDKYLLYQAKTVAEATDFTHPTNMGPDFVVYVNDKNNPTNVVGYRDGEIWYNAQGIEVSDPGAVLAGSNTTSGNITPYLVSPNDEPGDESFLQAFKDYDPQITVMPRIAFSFPISDVANFFAHYDVLTQRPSSFVRMDPSDYLYLETAQATINNPNLKPERTTDYELGFSQVLSEKKNSSITLSAFYRELRDMIQGRKIYQAYPVTYTTFDNLDFGTVKGFSVTYDLRRSGSVQMTTSYTLQFADGTGSSATSGLNLIGNGQPNLRATVPLDFDQRHTIVTNVDYRFGGGKNYRGPVWTRGKGTDKEKSYQILKDVGANLVFRAGSGLPYSKLGIINQEAAFGINQRSSLKGSINGSNLPWNFRVDLRIDKNLELTWGGKKKEGEETSKEKVSNLNVYLLVLNVLNAKNVQNVYRFTGNPDDDGYLAAAEYQNQIDAQTNPDSFIDLYRIKVNNPANYSIPRRIRLGLTLDF